MIVSLAAAASVLALAGPAAAAKQCAEPGAEWERATPEEAGMDAAGLQDALDYGSSEASYAIRVFRHGCLVGEDRFASSNRNSRYESWSMAKSVTALGFGRAMALRLVSPEDPIGSLLPEADKPHGAITAHDLLTMTSGLRWNGFRDYNIFTMQDRVHDALTLEVAHPPGTYFEYAQSAVALLAEAAGRSAGEDFQAFIQRELMDPLGIPAGAWDWSRDPAGHVQGFYGVQMRVEDFGRLGELLRRGGVWRGRRLLSRRFVREAIAPSPTNGCYGWLIWVNSGVPCIGPTISARTVAHSRDFPTLPRDMYSFSGLFGQRVTVFPSLGLMVVRTGQDPGVIPGTGRELGGGALPPRARLGDRPGGRAPGRRAARPRRRERRLRLPDGDPRAGRVQQVEQPRPAPTRRPRARPRRPADARSPARQPPRPRGGQALVPSPLAEPDGPGLPRDREREGHQAPPPLRGRPRQREARPPPAEARAPARPAPARTADGRSLGPQRRRRRGHTHAALGDAPAPEAQARRQVAANIVEGVTPRAWFLFLAVSVLWGIPYLFIKIAVDDGIPPAFLAWARVVIGAVLLYAISWRLGLLRDLPGHWRVLAVYAIVEIAVPFPLIAAGEQAVSSSLAAILIASVPLLVALLALRFDRSERATGRRLVGLFVGLAGVVALVGIDVAGDSEELLGAAAILLAAVGYAAGPMLLKRSLAEVDARALMAGALAIAAVALTPAALVAPPDEAPTAEAWVAIAVLGVFCTAAAFVFFGGLVAEVGPSRASVITYVAPVVALALGIAVLDERPGVGAIAGLLLILVGSRLATGGRRPEEAPPPLTAASR